MELHARWMDGKSLIGGAVGSGQGKSFRAIDPATGLSIEPLFYAATADEIDRAANLAADAFATFSKVPGKVRAQFLRDVAAALTDAANTIIERAHMETGLPLPRLQGELARTTGQLKLFAELLEEGSWVNARIDPADRERKPLPRPDLRSMSKPRGPVAVFGASNFPLAFSVAGGDTASALAAGNPVVVKAHPAHPGTSELVGKVIRSVAENSGLPAGVFSLLFDAGIEVGTALVQHPAIKAVAFTGSTAGGMALMRLAADRPEPIPCYAEMGSVNPLFILPEAIKQRPELIAQGLQTSFTLGSGQFCTKPGLVFVPQTESELFLDTLTRGVNEMGQYQMLTPGIAVKYKQAVANRGKEKHADLLACSPIATDNDTAVAPAMLFSTSIQDFLAKPELSDEIFGPSTILIRYSSLDELVKAAERFHGHLTATLHGTAEDLAAAQTLVTVLENKVGRLLFNGYPTGVEVCHAMVHGGPFPATSDGRSTSVGSMAIDRFTRPVCYQDFPDAALPAELQAANPLGIMRLVNGTLTRT